MAIKLLSFPQLKAEKGISFHRDYLRRLVKSGQFPRPIKIGAARIAWSEAEIDLWIDARAQERV
jgi:prophage regulatory protein